MASTAGKTKSIDSSHALQKTSTLEGINYHDSGEKPRDSSTRPTHSERSSMNKTSTIADPQSEVSESSVHRFGQNGGPGLHKLHALNSTSTVASPNSKASAPQKKDREVPQYHALNSTNTIAGEGLGMPSAASRPKTPANGAKKTEAFGQTKLW